MMKDLETPSGLQEINSVLQNSVVIRKDSNPLQIIPIQPDDTQAHFDSLYYINEQVLKSGIAQNTLIGVITHPMRHNLVEDMYLAGTFYHADNKFEIWICNEFRDSISVVIPINLTDPLSSSLSLAGQSQTIRLRRTKKRSNKYK